jgi:hypothetical protein
MNMAHSTGHLRTSQSVWFGLFLLLAPLGSYLLFRSISHPGQFVDEVILLAGLLIAFALSSLFLAVEQQFRFRASAEQSRQSSRLSAKMAPARKGPHDDRVAARTRFGP